MLTDLRAADLLLMIFKDIFNYYLILLKNSRKWIYFTGIVFLMAAILGFIEFNFQPHLIETIFKFFNQIIENNKSGDEGLVWAIFKQNLTTSLIALIGGILLAIIPFLIVLSNGFIIGYVIHFLYNVLPTNNALKIIIIVVTLVPHGIFELPIVLISASLGIKWGSRWLLNSSKGQRFTVFKEDAKHALYFIPLLILILIIAAYIEVFVSGKLIGVFTGKLSV